MKYTKVHIVLIVLSLVSVNLLQAQKGISYDSLNEFLTCDSSYVEDVLEYLFEELDLYSVYPSLATKNKVITGQYTLDNIDILLYDLARSAELEFYKQNRNTVLFRQKNQPEKAQLYGYVIDSDSGNPVELVAVQLHERSIGDFTNEFGYFEINLPSEKVDAFSIQMLGYEDRLIRLQDFKQGGTIEITPSIFDIELIEIKSKPTELSFPQGAIKLHSGYFARAVNSPLGSDVLRSLQMMPGVVAHDDTKAELKIRGSDSDEHMILLDGIPIYNAYHFYGIYSNINPLYSHSLDFYKNALPIQYGGKTGSLIEIKSRDEIQSFGGALDLNLLNAQIHLKSRLHKNWSLQLAGRSNFMNAAESELFNYTDASSGLHELSDQIGLTRRDLLNTNPDLSFSDLNAKLYYSTEKGVSGSFNAFYSNDHLTNKYSHEFFSRQSKNDLRNMETMDYNDEWENQGLSFNINQVLDDKVSIKYSGYYSKYLSDAKLLSSLEKTGPEIQISQSFSNSHSNKIEDLGVNMQASYVPNTTHEIEFGLFGQKLAVDASFIQEEKLILAHTEDAFNAGFFLNDHVTSGDLSVSGGIRTSYFSGTDKMYISPRLNFSLKKNVHLSYKASFNINHQFANEINHENRLGQTIDLYVLNNSADLPVGRSLQYMAGLNYKKEGLLIDLEFYNRYIYNTLTNSRNVIGFPDGQGPQNDNGYKVYVGNGRSYGMDILLGYAKDFWNVNLSYTLSKTTDKIEDFLQGLEFPDQDDRRHQLKLLNEFSLRGFDIYSNLLFSSGRPYNDLSLLKMIEDRRNIRPEDLIRTLPDYFRVDLGCSYKFGLAGKTAKISMSVLNIFNRENVQYQQYLYSVSNTRLQSTINTVIGTQTALLDRTLNLSFRLDF